MVCHAALRTAHLPAWSLSGGRQATGLWRQLEGVKPVFAELRGAGDAFDKTIAKYYAAVRSGRGGLFLAVCRGKVRGLGLGCGLGAASCGAVESAALAAHELGISRIRARARGQALPCPPSLSFPTYPIPLRAPCLAGVRGHRLRGRQRARRGGAVHPLSQPKGHQVRGGS